MVRLNTVKCDNCGAPAPATQQEEFPDGGWDLPYETFGYYGGFDDNMRVLMGIEEPDHFVMCHDCVLVMLDALPGLKARMSGGGHPNWNEPRGFRGNPLEWSPCCEFAWTYHDDKTYLGQADGTWMEAHPSDTLE